MTPSRSSTISLTARVETTASEASWTIARYVLRFSSSSELRDVGDAVHRCSDATKKREAIGTHGGIVRHHHHVVEEAIDGGLGGGERLERRRVVALCAVVVDHRRQVLERLPQIVLRAVGETSAVDDGGRVRLPFAQGVDGALCGAGP